jgi:hypothetical protein
MFSCGPSALQRLFDLGLTRDEFVCYGQRVKDSDTETIVDGTILHALETHNLLCYQKILDSTVRKLCSNLEARGA